MNPTQNIPLSVIVPVYNAGRYLEECLDSILGQSFADFELLLVNDGSTDGSEAICEAYAEIDPRIRFFSQTCPTLTGLNRFG